MKSKYRIILYTHDGAGLGHLSRISKIASALVSDKIHCLVLSGYREMSQIVPNNVDFIKLISHDSLSDRKSEYWGRKSFLRMKREESIILRKKEIERITKWYEPHAFIVDFFPLGKNDELLNLVVKNNHKILFYNIQRGIIGSKDVVENDILTSKNIDVLSNYFKRIFIVNDSKVFDFCDSYEIPKELRSKIVTTGYIGKKLSDDQISHIRNYRGINDGDKWILCTPGGGKLGESFIEMALTLPHRFPNISFDIVSGYRSAFKSKVLDLSNMKFHNSLDNLSYYIAASDICITTGGYNSIVESLINNTKIVICPSQIAQEDEQYLHTCSLKIKLNYNPLVDSAELIPDKLEELLKVSEFIDYHKVINFNGLENIKQLIEDDLSSYQTPA